MFLSVRGKCNLELRSGIMCFRSRGSGHSWSKELGQEDSDNAENTLSQIYGYGWVLLSWWGQSNYKIRGLEKAFLLPAPAETKRNILLSPVQHEEWFALKFILAKERQTLESEGLVVFPLRGLGHGSVWSWLHVLQLTHQTIPYFTWLCLSHPPQSSVPSPSPVFQLAINAWWPSSIHMALIKHINILEALLNLPSFLVWALDFVALLSCPWWKHRVI